MSNRDRQFALLFIASDVSQKLRSVLEICAVVAIVMLLITFTLRNHETYIVRGQLSEAFHLMSTVRAEMIVYRAQFGQWPDSEVNLYNPTLSQRDGVGQFVDHLRLHDGGSFSAVFDNNTSASGIRGRQLTFRPIVVSASPGSPVFWACAAYSAPDGMTPSGTDESTIEAAHLPSACRDY